jgi:hypothetical protein
MSSAPNNSHLRRVDLAVLSKRGFDLAQKFGVSTSHKEVWIDVEEDRSIYFFTENNTSIRACLGGARSRMLGFPELVAAFARAADDTALLDKQSLFKDWQALAK